jgi:hypothetical protein
VTVATVGDGCTADNCKEVEGLSAWIAISAKSEGTHVYCCRFRFDCWLEVGLHLEGPATGQLD